ncbi:MAG: rhodanese-like domain-containing protein [Syntrophobacteraceae bacterium]|nr:rhodanese-like domain-containing protein [Syntrophobacteraceae bacterium]
MNSNQRKSFPLEALKQGLLIVCIAAALSLLVNHLRRDGLPLARGPAAKASLNVSPGPEEPLVTLEEARALFLAHAAVFIDARPGEDYHAGHIQGALNLPANSLEQALPRIASKVSPDSPVIAYCDGDHCPLSREVASQLLARGYSHVMVLVNGWTLWRDAGLPVAKGR